MLSQELIEQSFREFTANMPAHAHDGITRIDLKFLHDSGLLATLQNNQAEPEDLSQFFHVMESPEKVTLFNEQFVIWIVPKTEEENPSTLVLIALVHGDKPTLEVVFTTQGVYNTPRYVLKILQHFLNDMSETEATVLIYEKNG